MIKTLNKPGIGDVEIQDKETNIEEIELERIEGEVVSF